MLTNEHLAIRVPEDVEVVAVSRVIAVLHHPRPLAFTIACDIALQSPQQSWAWLQKGSGLTTHLHGSCASILLADDVTVISPHLLVGDEGGPS